MLLDKPFAAFLSGVFRVLMIGRYPKVGALFRYHKREAISFNIHQEPKSFFFRRFTLRKGDSASFLVLERLKREKLLDQWVKVLYSRQGANSVTEEAVGWIDYLDLVNLTNSRLEQVIK